jgi:IclR family transcriptional regulator, acetate operon repressor
LLKDLVAAGIVDRASDGTYAIGAWLPVESDGSSLTTLRNRASKVMTDLAITTQRPVRLGIMSDNAVAFIERAAEHHMVESFRHDRLPLHASALGKALLAHSSRQIIDSTVAAGLERYTERTIVSREQLLAELLDVRRAGMATDWGESDVGHAAVAVPVTPVGCRIAALEIPATSMSDMAKVGPTLRIAARTLTRQLSDLTPAVHSQTGGAGRVSRQAGE